MGRKEHNPFFEYTSRVGEKGLNLERTGESVLRSKGRKKKCSPSPENVLLVGERKEKWLSCENKTLEMRFCCCCLPHVLQPTKKVVNFLRLLLKKGGKIASNGSQNNISLIFLSKGTKKKLSLP